MSKSEKNFSRKSLRSKNQRLILETIKKNERISRAELSQTLNISAPSISENVDLLLKRGLIYEAGVGHSSGGRKPVVLSYNYDYRYLLAVSLSGTGMKISLSNLALDLLRIKNIERFYLFDFKRLS